MSTALFEYYVDIRKSANYKKCPDSVNLKVGNEGLFYEIEIENELEFSFLCSGKRGGEGLLFNRLVSRCE